eukprot:11183171-Lingulodinium_polyedra.AAC.1
MLLHAPRACFQAGHLLEALVVELQRAAFSLQEAQAPLHGPGPGHGPVAESLLPGRLVDAAPRALPVAGRG